MRYLPIIAALAALAALTACQARILAPAGPSTTETAVKKDPRPVVGSPSPRAGAGTPAPSVPAGTDRDRRLAGLAAALRDAQTARELARANNLISDRGGGLVSKIRTGIVSNNGGSVVGQNGGGLASGTPAGYALAQAAGPAPTPTPPIYKVIPHEDPPYYYLDTFYLPLFAGHIVGYDMADFKARGTAATEIERYAWDDVPFEPLARDPGVPFDLVRAHFGVRVERSRRLTFTTRIDIDFELYIKQPMPKILTAFKAMQATFVMAVPDGEGGTDELLVRARDYVYPPGAGPGETPDGTYPMPIAFAGDGANKRGKLTVQIASPPAGDVTATVRSTFERAAGGTVASTVSTYLDGRRDEQITDSTTGLQVKLRFTPDGAGTGEVLEPGGSAALGRLTWDATGKGTIALASEAEAPIQVR